MGHPIAVPFADLTPQERRTVAVRANKAMVDLGVQAGIAGKPELINVRPALVGDAASLDWTDLRVRTSVVAGLEWWGQAAADLTVNRLSSVMSATFQVPDKSVIGIFGFVDLSDVFDLVGLRYVNGAEDLLYVQTEQAYGDPDQPAGMLFIDADADELTPALMVWNEGDIVDIQQAHKAAANRFVVHLALIAERAGKRQKKSS